MGKSILITGGTGSFGRAFIDNLLRRFKPKSFGNKHNHRIAPNLLAGSEYRQLILEGSDDDRREFQEQLKQSRQSSHMWIVAQRPASKA